MLSDRVKRALRALARRILTGSNPARAPCPGRLDSTAISI